MHIILIQKNYTTNIFIPNINQKCNKVYKSAYNKRRHSQLSASELVIYEVHSEPLCKAFVFEYDDICLVFWKRLLCLFNESLFEPFLRAKNDTFH